MTILECLGAVLLVLLLCGSGLIGWLLRYEIGLWLWFKLRRRRPY